MLHNNTADLLNLARSKNIWIATAESCTGGLIATTLTDVSGSSDVFAGGFVTYANNIKEHILGVSGDDLARHGAVSEIVARSMSEHTAVKIYDAMGDANKIYVSIASTGIAGPSGGSDAKPVGTVHLACSVLKPTHPITTLHEHHVFTGERIIVREKAVKAAISLMLRQILR